MVPQGGGDGGGSPSALVGAVVGESSGGVIELDADALLDAVAPPPIASIPTPVPRSTRPTGSTDVSVPSLPVPSLPAAVVGDLLVVADDAAPAGRPRWRERRAARRLQARRVGRIVRHVDVWSVVKVALLVHLCAFVVTTLAGVMLWSVAVDVGVVADVEDFVRSAFALQSFAFDGERIFRVAVSGGLGLVALATIVSALLAVVFNLISDLVGGIRLTVVEEETVRPVPIRRS